jgi:RNA polymerase sigma-70 factor (family 1)
MLEQAVPHTDRELINDLSVGSRTAFTKIYTQYYPSLHRYLVVITKSNQQADEILQDVFLKLWIKKATLTGIRSLQDYLFTMTRNGMTDALRGDKRYRNYLKAIDKQETSNETVDELTLKEYHHLVREGLKEMPERRQQIFLMNARDEMTAKQIAEQLNISLPAVKKQLYEAQQHLRKYLAEHGDILMTILFACSIIK